MNIVLMIAGGKGERMRNDIPKQYMEVYGKPLIVYTLETVQKAACVDEIVLVCASNWRSYMEQIAGEYRINKLRAIVLGGSTRHESVSRGVEYIRTFANKGDIVCIHEACRPLVSEKILSDNIDAAQKYGAALAVDTCCDSMYLQDENAVLKKTLNRGEILKGQSPEAARFDLLQYVYNRANHEQKCDLPMTALMLNYGIEVTLTKGAPTNFKITTAEDIELFSAYILLQKIRQQKQAETEAEQICREA